MIKQNILLFLLISLLASKTFCVFEPIVGIPTKETKIEKLGRIKALTEKNKRIQNKIQKLKKKNSLFEKLDSFEVGVSSFALSFAVSFGLINKSGDIFNKFATLVFSFGISTFISFFSTGLYTVSKEEYKNKIQKLDNEYVKNLETIQKKALKLENSDI